MPRNRFNPDFEDKEMVEEAIPAAIRVKQDILDMRKSAVMALGDVMQRRSTGRPVRKQEMAFQSNVIGLYSLLSMNFPIRKKSKSKNPKTPGQLDMHETLDGFIENGKPGSLLKWPVLYKCFLQLEKKIYDIGITKIVIKKTPGEQVF